MFERSSKHFVALSYGWRGLPRLFGFRLGTSQFISGAVLTYASLSSGSYVGNSSEAANFTFFIFT